jgi:hypothetical protein
MKHLYMPSLYLYMGELRIEYVERCARLDHSNGQKKLLGIIVFSSVDWTGSIKMSHSVHSEELPPSAGATVSVHQ